MNDMEKAIWLAARMIKNQPELFAQAPAECMIILKTAYGEAAFSTPTEAAENLTISQIRELLNMVQLIRRLTPELVTPELIQREIELSELLTLKLESQAPTPELIKNIQKLQNQQQQERISPLTNIEKYL